MSLGPAEVLALTGMMGSGKSATARALAELTGRKIFSVDAEIVRRAGMPIADIFARDGEEAFRALEEAAVASIPEGAIADLGGGAFCQPKNAERLLSVGRVVFLEVSAREAARRIGDPGSRPLAGRWEELHEARLPLYRRAQLSVHTDGKTPREVARRILEAL